MLIERQMAEVQAERSRDRVEARHHQEIIDPQHFVVAHMSAVNLSLDDETGEVVLGMRAALGDQVA